MPLPEALLPAAEKAPNPQKMGILKMLTAGWGWAVGKVLTASILSVVLSRE